MGGPVIAKAADIIRQVIGWYEVVTGGFGALYFGHAAMTSGGISSLGLMFVGLYALTAVAGLALATKLPAGWLLSLVVQAAQVVRVSTPRWAYLFTAGAAWWLQVGSAGFDWHHDFGVRFRIFWTTGFGPSPVVEQVWLVGVNLVPMVIIGYLVYGCRRPRKR